MQHHVLLNGLTFKQSTRNLVNERFALNASTDQKSDFGRSGSHRISQAAKACQARLGMTTAKHRLSSWKIPSAIQSETGWMRRSFIRS